MPIDYFDELAGSPTVDIQLNGGSAKREAKIPWDKLLELADYLFPFGSSYPATFPTLPWLYAQSMHVEPFIGDKDVMVTPIESDLSYDSINTTEFAKVSIDYGSLGYNTQDSNNQDNNGNVDPVLMLSHRWTIGGEFLTIEAAGLQWCNGDNVSSDVTAGMLIPTVEHQITWPRIRKPPFQTIRDRIGCVNNSFMTFRTGTIYPETLLFLGVEMHRDVKTDGTLGWEVVYRFSEKRVRVSLGFQSECGLISESDCSAYGGTWDGRICRGYAGGWNHFYRSDATNSGFQRLLSGTVPTTETSCIAAGGTWSGNSVCVDYAAPAPIYALKSFSELFVEDL